MAPIVAVFHVLGYSVLVVIGYLIAALFAGAVAIGMQFLFGFTDDWLMPIMFLSLIVPAFGVAMYVRSLPKKITQIASEREWAERAAAFVTLKLQEAKLTHAELARRLTKHGFSSETEALVVGKLHSGVFPATWFLACLAALELDGVALEEI